MRFYSKVPKEVEANLRFRMDIRKKAASSEKVRRQIWKACEHDVLFWMNAFCWLYEPRPRIVDGVRMPMTIPMITWPHQDVAIDKIKANLGFEDILVTKSRGEGMSWIAVLLAIHDWIFMPETKIGIVSRTEEAADDPEDSDSIFWKIDWELTKLPQWMSGVKGKDFKRIIDRHTLTNFRNRSIIKAGAATGDVFRGGRLTYAIMDEFAFFKKGDDAEALNSSHGATNSRLFISTVNGQHNEFFKLHHQESSKVSVIIDWKQNISRNRGLYTLVKGIPVAVDPVNNPLPDHYNPPSQAVKELFARLRKRGFKLERSQRSPWYDHECDRPGMTPQRIAQELDMDFSGSEFLVFGAEYMDQVTKTVSTPTHIGNITVHEHTDEGELELKAQFQSVWDGQVRLWVPLDIHGNPPPGRYCLGADISTGLGGDYTSNSTLIGLNMDTGEQVFAFASNTIEISDFADLAVATANWFGGAYLGWEHNGPGSAFTKRIIQVKYGNVYRRKSHSKKSKTRTKELGWWTDDKTKPAMFADMIRTVRSSEIIVRDEQLSSEFKQYIYLNGKIEHASSLTTDDDSSKGKSHGDRVMGFGVAVECFLDRNFTAHVKAGAAKGSEIVSGKIPPDSMAARFRQYEREERQGSSRSGWYGSVLQRRSF